MSKHTPGPWTIVENDDIFIEGPDKRICTIPDNGNYLPWEVAQSNARLISAAPELLAFAIAHQEWEAKLIADDKAWMVNNSPMLIEEHYDEFIRLQDLRNMAFEKIRGGEYA